ncbi:MAG TPA: DUF4157 domain-containing protein [Candidatus Sulfotelmatobacter sp.]|nr:DUF4157 domain-containing protein [Candidatus Sulfotelmatobacter sp.]
MSHGIRGPRPGYELPAVGANRHRSPPSGRGQFAAPGSRLRADLRSELEPFLGRDLSQIRVHDDPAAGAAASALGARAYTIGPEIFFAPGQYAPQTAHGRALLTHEVVHAIQQTRVGQAPQPDGGSPRQNPNAAAEKEAHELGSIGERRPHSLRAARSIPRANAPFGWPQFHDDGTVHTHLQQWDNPAVASVVYPNRDDMMGRITTTLGKEEAASLGGMDEETRQKAVVTIRAQIEERLTALKARPDAADGEIKKSIDKLQALAAAKPVSPQQIVVWATNFLGADLHTAGMSSADLFNATRAQMQASGLPDWAQTILVDYGGMRYKSSHGSWLPAGDLLARLLEHDLAKPDEDHLLPDDWPDPLPAGWPAPTTVAAGAAPSAKPAAKARPPHVPRIDNLTAQALLQELHDLGNMPDDVWSIIVEFTELRTQTDEPKWEVAPVEPKSLPKAITDPWRSILISWRQAKFTAWRPEMESTNRLLATQVVCNELGEALQARRGVSLPGGITANADWIYQQSQAAAKPPAAPPSSSAPAAPAQGGPSTSTPAGSPAKAAAEAASFKQGTNISAADLKPGATLFFIQSEWAPQPHAWDAVRPIPGAKYVVPKGTTPITDGLVHDGWRYEVTADLIARTQILPQHFIGPPRKEFMNWQHQATVLSVYDSTVVTIETVWGHGAGITTRSVKSLSVPTVFVGYVAADTKGSERAGEHEWALRATHE